MQPFEQGRHAVGFRPGDEWAGLHAENSFDVAVHQEEIGIGAAKEQHPDIRVGFGALEKLEQRSDERAVHQIAGRVVDRDDRDAGIDGGRQGS